VVAIFFTFALSWGLNSGLLESKYRPNLEKALSALYKNVNNEGRLGYVQKMADDPYPFMNMNGMFMLPEYFYWPEKKYFN
jgi:rhamnogalacturonyl hydrolase YesR